MPPEHEAPRVTRILSDLGLSMDHQFTDPYYASRGQAVHKITELIDKGTLDEDSVEEELQPYASGYRLFLRESGYSPRFCELRLHHIQLHYQGAIDKLGLLNGRFGILDIKTSLAVDPATDLQLCGYEELCQAGSEPFPYCEGFAGIGFKYALQLKPDGRYNLITKWSRTNSKIWLAVLKELRTAEPQPEVTQWRMRYSRLRSSNGLTDSPT